ncbi:MAG: VanZ family protein [Stomatobaculum sp.]|nr:VanZ family protein [Stomatobaculum sp.]
MRRRVFLLLTVLWMAVIFCFSSKDAASSTEDSYLIGRTAAVLLVPGFRGMSAEEQQAVVKSMDHKVRKTAHFFEYAVLGALLAGVFFQAGSGKTDCIRQGIRAWAAGIGYAASDEIHQMFVPGRACMWTDVVLDSAGVLAGLLLGWCVLFFCSSCTLRKNQREVL